MAVVKFKINDMKTKEQIASEWTGRKLELFTDTAGLEHIHPYITPKQCLKAMESYHREQLSAGIKAKALRKKGTDKWYYFYPHDASFNESSYPDLFSDVDMTVERIPKDADLVNIIILEEKP